MLAHLRVLHLRRVGQPCDGVGRRELAQPEREPERVLGKAPLSRRRPRSRRGRRGRQRVAAGYRSTTFL
eukprot:5201249-Prymnesium_polylepis.1